MMGPGAFQELAEGIWLNGLLEPVVTYEEMKVRRKVFVFRGRPTRRGDVMSFYGAAATVRPLAFAATVNDKKGLLHNG